MGILGGQKFKSPGNVIHGLPRESTSFFFKSFMAQTFQKSRKFHELPRKWFHFIPLTSTHPGGAVLGDTEGERDEEGRSKGARREEGGRQE